MKTNKPMQRGRTLKRATASTLRSTAKSPSRRNTSGPESKLQRTVTISRRRPASGRQDSKSATRQAQAVSADTLRIREVLEQLNRVQAELNARSTDLLTVANDIRREAVGDFKAGVVANLVEGQLLPDLHRLASLSLPAPLALVPESMLNWLCQHLDLAQHLQSGQHLEIPAHQLDQYELEGIAPDPAKSLVQVQVLCPGWKWREKLIIPPRVTLAQSPAERPTPDAKSLR